MKNILSRDNREVLEQFAWSNMLLAFDFDGTLAPIVSVPDRAAMRKTTCALLEKVARLYPCVVISGRARGDVIERLGNARALGVIGNHGMEPWQLHDRFRDAVDGWHPVLEKRLGHVKGVVIEYKTYSLSIHYRRSREKKRARAAILRAVSILDNARIIGGEQVVNILPGGAPHKGIALEQERVRLHCDTAVYIGDDETDEDVFVLDRPGRLLTIRVGAKRASKAAYCIRNQHQIDEFLETMLVLRQGRRGAGGCAYENG
jgi:trehalose 6-phosphate phosphatase